MKGINDYFTFLSTSTEKGTIIDQESSVRPVNDPGYSIKSYPQLLNCIAAIKYQNPSFDIFFRGQNKDYPTNDNGLTSGLYPSIFRNAFNRPSGALTPPKIVQRRYEILNKAENILIDELSNPDLKFNAQMFKRFPILRWSILQHYEICDTPLLDVAPVLDIALTFGSGQDQDSAYLYGIALPRHTQIVSNSVLTETQSINLAQICPPNFLRPHYQNGFLIGNYPSVMNYEVKIRGTYNFSNRLLVKFKIENIGELTRTGFNKLLTELIMPDEQDQLIPIVKSIAEQIKADRDELQENIYNPKIE